jgi:hypothetical protein
MKRKDLQEYRDGPTALRNIHHPLACTVQVLSIHRISARKEHESKPKQNARQSRFVVA